MDMHKWMVWMSSSQEITMDIVKEDLCKVSGSAIAGSNDNVKFDALPQLIYEGNFCKFHPF